jgi:phasin family protein
MFNFEDANKKNKETMETMDTMVKSYASLTKTFQAIATEAADYSKKAFEDSVAHIEKISTVKSVEAAFELQTGFVKSAYEGYVAEATKIGEMYADLAKDTYKPYQAPVAKATAAVKAAAVA